MEDKKYFTGASFVFFNGSTRSQIPGTAKHANRKDRKCKNAKTKNASHEGKKAARGKNSPFKTVQKETRRGLRRRLKTFFSGHKTKPFQPRKCSKLPNEYHTYKGKRPLQKKYKTIASVQ